MLLLLAGLLIGLGWLATLPLRRRSAAERHLVWALVFAGLLLLPLLRETAPVWRPAALHHQMATAARVMARTVARTVVFVTAADDRAPACGWPVASTFFAIWLAGAALCTVRLIRAHSTTARLAAASTPFQDGVKISQGLSVPIVAGVFRPVILLPAAAPSWPAGELASVLAHERMHIERRDNLWQAMTQLVCSLYWPQPLVWLAAYAMRQECERACDDGVLAQGTPATAYAAVLVNIARGLSQQEAAPAGGLAMTRTTQLHHRIAALLDPGTARRAASRRFASTAVAFALASVLALAGLESPLFGQQSRLSGVVRDPSGANIPRARIDLRSPGTDNLREVIYSSASGEFSLDNVPDGVYDMTVAAPGFAMLTQSNLLFENGKTQPFAITLEIGKIRETVMVEGVAEGPAAATGGPATAASGAPKRIRVGGNVQAAKLVQKVRPLYPITAKQDHVEGTVLLRAVVGLDGAVVTVEPLNRAVDARLTEAAMTAVRLWRYSPTLLNGQPVEIVTVVEVNFTLTR